MAPSEIVDQATAGVFGKVAETLIETDYCAKMGCAPFATDFFDASIGAAPYIAFLAAHNPHVDVPLLAVQVGLSGGILIPDMLAHLPARRDFYEIKPNSIDGRPAGRAKLAAIEAFMAFNSLGYVPGIAYVPGPLLPIPLSGPALTVALGAAGAIALTTCGPITASLEVERPLPGLVLYRLCITADFECYAKVIGLTVLAAAIVAVAIAAIIGSGGGVLIPAGGLAPALVPVLAL